MKIWQKIWLIIAIIWSSLHLIRDVFQDIGIKNFLSTPFVKHSPYTNSSLYWLIFFNTYAYAIAVLSLSIYSLKRKQFGKAGYATIILSVAIFVAWLYYWFFL